MWCQVCGTLFSENHFLLFLCVGIELTKWYTFDLVSVWYGWLECSGYFLISAVFFHLLHFSSIIFYFQPWFWKLLWVFFDSAYFNKWRLITFPKGLNFIYDIIKISRLSSVNFGLRTVVFIFLRPFHIEPRNIVSVPDSLPRVNNEASAMNKRIHYYSRLASPSDRALVRKKLDSCLTPDT